MQLAKDRYLIKNHKKTSCNFRIEPQLKSVSSLTPGIQERAGRHPIRLNAMIK
jgi:hypothetical protein